ncbi:hypothetical protein AB1N83_005149 [Pleurotus pulmonarius]
MMHEPVLPNCLIFCIGVNGGDELERIGDHQRLPFNGESYHLESLARHHNRYAVFEWNYPSPEGTASCGPPSIGVPCRPPRAASGSKRERAGLAVDSAAASKVPPPLAASSRSSIEGYVTNHDVAITEPILLGSGSWRVDACGDLARGEDKDRQHDDGRPVLKERTSWCLAKP